MKTYIRHEVLANCFGLSLPEICFQEFFTLFINGKEIGGGIDVNYAHKLASIYGQENVEVSPIPVFMGFSEDPEIRRNKKRFGY